MKSEQGKWVILWMQVLHVTEFKGQDRNIDDTFEKHQVQREM